MAAFERRRRIKPARASLTDPATGERISPWPFVGLVLVLSSLFLYAFAGLLAPWWAVIVGLLVWLAMFVLVFRWWRRPAVWTVGLGVFSYAFWFAAVTAGGVFLDWTA